MRRLLLFLALLAFGFFEYQVGYHAARREDKAWLAERSRAWQAFCVSRSPAGPPFPPEERWCWNCAVSYTEAARSLGEEAEP